MLKVTVYYRGRIQIKIGPREEAHRTESGEAAEAELCCPLHVKPECITLLALM